MPLRPLLLGLALSACVLVATTCGSGGGGGGGPDAGPPDAGLPLGSSCTIDSDCASDVCRPFRQQTVNLCTKPCAAATQATDCPVPPTAGTCAANGYCEFH
jgi:hypothetical protein